MSGDETDADQSRRTKDAATRLRPSVIAPARGREAGAGREPRLAGTIEPTVIAGLETPRRVRPSPGGGRPTETASRAAARPTAMPGTERKRIAVAAGDLLRLSPLATSKVVERALRGIAMFVDETASDRRIALWGHDAQRRYGALVSRSVELSQASVLTRTEGYLRRMTQILAAVDVVAASGAAPPTGFLERVLRRTDARIDTPGELETARVEIDTLVALTGAALEELLSLRQALERQADEIAEAAEEIEAAALAAEFLAGHLRDERVDLSRRFLERGMSLTQSLAQIRAGAPAVAVQAEQPLRLVAAVQDVVLVALPGLLGSFAALNAAARAGGRLNPTEAGEIAFRLRDVLQRLGT